jgi:hypothetical protein
MQIERSDAQPLKAACSISRGFEPASKVQVASEAQFSKQQEQITSTPHGIQIDASDSQRAKALAPKTRSRVSRSKATVSSSRQSANDSL